MNPDMIPPVGGHGAGGFEDDPMEEDVDGEGEGDEEGVINLS